MKRLIYAIIPARGGSKGVPKKNIKSLNGFPLIAYTIAAAQLSKKIDRIIVSTESSEIANIAREYGAEVPFIRPDKYAQDQSPDIDFVKHAINWFKNNEKDQPDLFVHLRPTTPLRDPVLVDNAIDLFIKNETATALRSVHKQTHPPQKMFGIKGEFLIGLFPNETRPEYYNLPRQAFPQTYCQNGYVDIIKIDYVTQHNLLHGPRTIGFITPQVIEIDTPDDFDYLEYISERKSHQLYIYLKEKFRPD